MGGLLFNLGRIERVSYLKLEAEVKLELDTLLGEYYRIPRFYADKADFGDMDIIVSNLAIQQSKEELIEEIKKRLQIKQTKSVGNVFSTNYKNFQVDFFFVPHAYFESTYNFMCFNDLGNIIGKIFRRFNLKYGETGLSYVFRRADEHYKKDLLLTTDINKILSFVQLDIAHWLRGFSSLDEMFRWVVASPYFSIKPYQEKSTKLKKRETQRKTVRKFVEWLEANHINKEYIYQDKMTYKAMINDFFPEANLLVQIAQEQKREEIVNAIKAKFNGHLVMKLTQLEGKELGSFMYEFQNSFEDFEAFVLANNPSDIELAIQNYFTQWI